MVVNGHRKSVKGLVFRAVGQPTKIIPTWGVPRPIHQVDIQSGKIIATYPSIRQASLATDIPKAGISNVANGAKKTYYGYRWEFVPQQQQAPSSSPLSTPPPNTTTNIADDS